MNYILFDKLDRNNFLPLSYTRPVSEIRIGILTITEKWNKQLNTKCSFQTEKYLQDKYKLNVKNDNCYIRATALPNQRLIDKITGLKQSQALFVNNELTAFRTSEQITDLELIKNKFEHIKTDIEITQIQHNWDIFVYNQQEIENDYKLITKGRISEQLPSSCRTIGKNIFVEKGVNADFITINARDAYVYIGENATIMDGAHLKGSIAICEGTVLNMGSKIYGASTFGPFSKVGGEVNNSVIIGYSNKGHDGFLGNSVLGEWCNLGADTNTSNLKNNYAEVKLWNYEKKRFLKTSQMFCGLIMGDHSKCGINTMFNTGTVVGVCANIFGSGFPRNFIPSFSWGGAHGFREYKMDKVFEVNKVVMKRRNKEFDDKEQNILKHVYDISKEFRRNY